MLLKMFEAVRNCLEVRAPRRTVANRAITSAPSQRKNHRILSAPDSGSLGGGKVPSGRAR